MELSWHDCYLISLSEYLLFGKKSWWIFLLGGGGVTGIFNHSQFRIFNRSLPVPEVKENFFFFLTISTNQFIRIAYSFLFFIDSHYPLSFLSIFKNNFLLFLSNIFLSNSCKFEFIYSFLNYARLKSFITLSTAFRKFQKLGPDIKHPQSQFNGSIICKFCKKKKKLVQSAPW